MCEQSCCHRSRRKRRLHDRQQRGEDFVTSQQHQPINTTMTYQQHTASQPRPPPWITMLLLAPTFFGIADGCYRQPKPDLHPSGLEGDNSMTTTTTTTPKPHLTSCNPIEVTEQGCFNGGTCLVSETPHGRELLCQCSPDWAGARCEQLHITLVPYPVQQHQIHTAHIAAGVCISILFVFVFLLAVYVWIRKKQKKPKSHRSHAAHRSLDEPDAGASNSLVNGKPSDQASREAGDTPEKNGLPPEVAIEEGQGQTQAKGQGRTRLLAAGGSESQEPTDTPE